MKSKKSLNWKAFIAVLFTLCILSTLFITGVNAEEYTEVQLTVQQIIRSEEESMFELFEAFQEPIEDFSYLLTPLSVSHPMPENSSKHGHVFHIRGTEKRSVDYITFNRPGHYKYKLSCIDSPPSYTVDTQEYEISVVILDDMSSYVLLYNEENEKVDGLSFIHSLGAEFSSTINISGTIKWHHTTRDNRYTNPTSKRPNSITLYVYADDVVVLQRVITAGDDWSWSINMDMFAEDGHFITYRVDESTISDYNKWVDGFDLINEYSPGASTDDLVEIDPPSGSNWSTGSKPITGDNSPLILFITLLCISGFVMLIVLLFLYINRFRPKTKQNL